MRLQEYYNLTPTEKEIQDRKAQLELQEHAKELDRLGIWNIPKDFKKRLAKGETLKIWESNNKYD